jgi:hypothetical protein
MKSAGAVDWNNEEEEVDEALVYNLSHNVHQRRDTNIIEAHNY